MISRSTNDELMTMTVTASTHPSLLCLLLSAPLRLGEHRHRGNSSSSSSSCITDGDVNHSVYCWHTHQSTSITMPATPVAMDTHLVCNQTPPARNLRRAALSSRRYGVENQRQMTGLWTRRSADFQGTTGSRASQKRPVARSMQPTIERNDAAIVSARNRRGNGAGARRRFQRSSR